MSIIVWFLPFLFSVQPKKLKITLENTIDSSDPTTRVMVLENDHEISLNGLISVVNL
jgi:hypothetical protein